MKTTLEFPDPLFRQAKAEAAQRGESLRAFVTEALREKLLRSASGGKKPHPLTEFFGVAKKNGALRTAIVKIDADVSAARAADVRLQIFPDAV